MNNSLEHLHGGERVARFDPPNGLGCGVRLLGKRSLRHPQVFTPTRQSRVDEHTSINHELMRVSSTP